MKTPLAVPGDSLAGITIFVAAARLGNFTLAADQLGISKSAVGKSIARLESRLWHPAVPAHHAIKQAYR